MLGGMFFPFAAAIAKLSLVVGIQVPKMSAKISNARERFLALLTAAGCMLLRTWDKGSAAVLLILCRFLT